MEQIRPFPPTDFIDQAEEEEAIRLLPAPDLKKWVVANYLTIGGPIYNPDHDHIAELLHDNDEFLAFAWASSAYKSKQAMVLGQCEKVMFNVGGWRKAEWLTALGSFRVIHIQQDPASTIWKCQLRKV